MDVTIYINGIPKTVSSQQSLLEILGARIASPCGGRGTCGKCRVEVDGKEVLACKTTARDGMKITLCNSQLGLKIETSGAVQDVDIMSDYPPEALGVAFDIGTTTVVGCLVELATGKRLGVVGEANAQKPFGADVISRIQAAGEGRLDDLQAAIISQLSEITEQLLQDAGRSFSDLQAMTLVGNTVMCHLAVGLSPATIGVAPFTPLSLFGGDFALRNLYDKVYITPSISGYVGGDITAGILAASMLKRQETTLLVDIGTNGEMALCHNGKIYCCATAAGPAFEGSQIKFGMMAQSGAVDLVKAVNGKLIVTTIDDAPPVGVCGSGLLDAIAAMLELEAMDETGRILDEDEAGAAALPYLAEFEDSMVFHLGSGVYITQADVRSVQLAKAAIAAGIETLLEESGVSVTDVSALLLAGGFGSHLKPDSAAAIGLIPKELLPVTSAIGNSALDGAIIALLSDNARSELELISQNCQYLELSGHKGFTEKYVDNMMFDVE